MALALHHDYVLHWALIPLRDLERLQGSDKNVLLVSGLLMVRWWSYGCEVLPRRD